MRGDVWIFEPILTSREKRGMREQLFRHREFVGVDLSRADLRGTRFIGTAIDSCNLVGADLRGAVFIECHLHSVVLHGARLGENRFDGTVLSDIVGLSEEARLSIELKGGAFRPPRASRR